METPIHDDDGNVIAYNQPLPLDEDTPSPLAYWERRNPDKNGANLS